MAKAKARTRHVVLPRETPAEEVRLLRRAANNNEGSRQAVRGLLAKRSNLVEALSSTADELEQALIQRSVGDGVLVQEGLRAELELFRKTLATPDDGPLEHLLISQISLNWIHLMNAQRLREERWAGGLSKESASFWDKHVSRLQVDYLRAVRSLATIRRIHGPAIQVNIAQQQVNQVTSS